MINGIEYPKNHSIKVTVSINQLARIFDDRQELQRVLRLLSLSENGVSLFNSPVCDSIADTILISEPGSCNKMSLYVDGKIDFTWTLSENHCDTLRDVLRNPCSCLNMFLFLRFVKMIMHNEVPEEGVLCAISLPKVHLGCWHSNDVIISDDAIVVSLVLGNDFMRASDCLYAAFVYSCFKHLGYLFSEFILINDLIDIMQNDANLTMDQIAALVDRPIEQVQKLVHEAELKFSGN